MREREHQAAVAAAASKAKTNTRQNRPSSNFTLSGRCVLDRGLPCCGQQRYDSTNERLTCNSCAPAGISIVRLPEQQQEQILQAVLYG